jgi:hypothetical protein
MKEEYTILGNKISNKNDKNDKKELEHEFKPSKYTLVSLRW